MNEIQKMAAREDLIEWLQHPNELGKKPSSIEYVEDFELHEMTYYIFKYKKSMLGAWLLGIAGGYEGDDLEHCGHVFSDMNKFDPTTAQDDAIAIIESIRTYFMNMAKSYSDRNPEDDE